MPKDIIQDNDPGDEDNNTNLRRTQLELARLAQGEMSKLQAEGKGYTVDLPADMPPHGTPPSRDNPQAAADDLLERHTDWRLLDMPMGGRADGGATKPVVGEETRKINDKRTPEVWRPTGPGGIGC